MRTLTLERPISPASDHLSERSERPQRPDHSGRPVRTHGHARRVPATAAARPAPRPQDPHALVRRLYADNGPALLAYVTRLLSDSHQAEDVVQETMVRAWKNADLLIPERGSVNGWLMRVAHNIAVDKIRARKARPDEVEESAAVPRQYDDHASAVVESVYVARALARLSPAHREILRVVYFADRTAAQAAEALQLPVGTVKSRTYHALRRLRAYLDEEINGSSR